jgi:pimeloyl-ACP methyl ester carboxylesterase
LRIDVGGHELRAAIGGEGPPDFVCLHGLVDSLEIWDRLGPALEARGRLLRFDQRGHGASDAPPGPYRREDLAGDAIALLDRQGIDRAILVGHSMGGIVAMTAALGWPDRVAGLVLHGTASQCSERIAEWYERIAQEGETHGTSGLARAIYGERSKRQIVGNADGIAHVTRALKSLYADPLTPKLGDVRCPSLLVVGTRDPMGPRASEIIAEGLPDATLEVLAERGHWTHVEAPDEVVAVLDPWLARHDLARHDPGPED